MTTTFSVQVVTTTLSDANADELRQRLAENGVLCLRPGERLTKEEFEVAAELLGPIRDPVARTRDGGMFRYSPRLQHIDSGYVATEEDRMSRGPMTFGGLDDTRPGLFETFHCDDTYTAEPAQLTVLHARALPASGGGPTVFMDMRAAFDLLPVEQQEQLSRLHVRYAYNNNGAFPTRVSASGEADCLEEVIHPLVRTHPLSGRRALFIDLDRACRVEELSLTEGRQLLQELQDHAETSAPRCEHTWQTGDVLIWDNASVQHKASGDFPVGEERRFWRHMVNASRPQ